MRSSSDATRASASSTSSRMSSRSSPEVSVSISRAGGDVLAGRAQLVPGPDDLTELLVAARQVAQAVLIGERGRIGQLCLDGFELRLERGHPVIEHAFPGLLVRVGTRRVAPAPAGSVLRAAGAGLAFALPLRSP